MVINLIGGNNGKDSNICERACFSRSATGAPNEEFIYLYIERGNPRG